MTANRPNTGTAIALCGISGAGKSHCARLLRDTHGMEYIPSVTTRAPRVGEVGGRDRVFLSLAEFVDRAATGQLVGIAENFGNLYGHDRDHILSVVCEGRIAVLEVRFDRIYEMRTQIPSLFPVYVVPKAAANSEASVVAREGVPASEQARRLAVGQGTR